MVSKNELTTLDTVCELKISHSDIVSMMNDDDVLLCGGSVDTSQSMEVFILRSNGSELSIEKFDSTDNIVFRFKTITTEGGETALNGIDVS